MDAYLSNISDLGDIPEMLNIDFKNSLLLWVMVVHTFDFSTQEVEAGGSLWVPGQLSLQREIQDSQGYIEKSYLIKNQK